MRQRLVGLCHRIAYATALAVTVFDLATLPLGLQNVGWIFHLLELLNLPVSLVSLALPYDWYGLGFPLGPTPWFGALAYWNHMRVAIPVYVGLFYLTGFVWSRLRAAWKRRGALAGSTASSQAAVSCRERDPDSGIQK